MHLWCWVRNVVDVDAHLGELSCRVLCALGACPYPVTPPGNRFGLLLAGAPPGCRHATRDLWRNVQAWSDPHRCMPRASTAEC